MTERARRSCRSRRVRVVILFALLVGASAAHAQQQSSRLGAFADFFRWREPIPAALRAALDAYTEGRFFAALGSVDGVIAARTPAYAMDDALFVRALCLIGIDWDDLAVPSLRAVVETNPPSPYYVPALLELVEIHDRASRWQAIADVWQQYVDQPLRSRGSRNERIARLLVEFGSLRPPVASSTRREKSLFSRPKELAVLLDKRRERSSDRLFYRCGLALLRLGRHEESLRALLTIGIDSPYYPYAGYSIAQNDFATGRIDDAARMLTRLEHYPKVTPEDRALGSRVQVLHAAIAFDSGEFDEGIRIAQAIAADDPEAPAARLLIATALLDAGKPSLAVVYDAAPIPAEVADEAKRALVVGSAYASLGDKDSAARVLRGAAGHVQQARLAGPALDEAIARLRALAEASLDDRRSRARASREHVSDAIRIILAHDAPWSFATMLRHVRAALGAGAYRGLALGTKPESAAAAPSAAVWLAYLASPRRPTIERMLDRLADIEAAPDESDPEDGLRIANAYVAWLEHAAPEPDRRNRAAHRAATLVRRNAAVELDPAAPAAATVNALRMGLLETADALADVGFNPDAVREARQDAASSLHQGIDGELRQVMQERDGELRGLELDLDVALSETLAPP